MRFGALGCGLLLVGVDGFLVPPRPLRPLGSALSVSIPETRSPSSDFKLLPALQQVRGFSYSVKRWCKRTGRAGHRYCDVRGGSEQAVPKLCCLIKWAASQVFFAVDDYLQGALGTANEALMKATTASISEPEPDASLVSQEEPTASAEVQAVANAYKDEELPRIPRQRSSRWAPEPRRRPPANRPPRPDPEEKETSASVSPAAIEADLVELAADGIISTLPP
jgi:hypothetical protein